MEIKQELVTTPSITDDKDAIAVIDDIDDTDNDEAMPPLEPIDLLKPLNPLGINNDVSEPKEEKNIVFKEEENEKTDDGNGYLDILNNGDLRKKTIKPGTGVRPQRGSKVIIRLETRLYNDGDDDKDYGTGQLIKDESFDKFKLILGDNDLHQGLDLLIPLMELNETCRAIIKPRFNYGNLGNKSVGIPENSTLDLTIELLEILQQSDNVYGETDEDSPDTIPEKTSIDERLKTGNYKKTRGNFWFERGEYSSAIQCYRGALKFFDANNEELKIVSQKTENNDQISTIEDLIDKRAQTFNNLAAAQMKLQAFDAALRSVKDSLLLRPNNVKALFRYAKILTETGDIETAIEQLKKGNEIDPKSEAIAMELDRLNKILAKQLRNQKELYRRMMQANNDLPTKLKNSEQNGRKCDNEDKQSDSQQKKTDNNSQSHFTLWSKYWPALGASVVLTAFGAVLFQIFKQ